MQNRSANIKNWRELIARFQTPNLRRSCWQIATSFAPFFAVWYAMYRSLDYSYFLTLLLAVLGGGFAVRIFILMHDCSHNSFFASRRANDALGAIAGFLSVTPYHEWRRRHAAHHAASGNLDKRGWWDFETFTVKEYLAMTPMRRAAYRLYRHPLVLFGIAPLVFFLVIQRFSATNAGRQHKQSVRVTNLVMLAATLAMSYLIGLKAFLLVEIPILWVASSAGIWLFYVQHQFEEAYWARRGEWDFVAAALEGSSHYKLPAILSWFTGHIGVHHIHHLNPKIPNYNLQSCHDENPALHPLVTLTLRESLQALRARVWDEDAQRMIDFKELRRTHRQNQPHVNAQPILRAINN